MNARRAEIRPERRTSEPAWRAQIDALIAARADPGEARLTETQRLLSLVFGTATSGGARMAGGLAEPERTAAIEYYVKRLAGGEAG